MFDEHPLFAAVQCRVCGCTDDHACSEAGLGACWWVEPDLCSHCFLARRERRAFWDGVVNALGWLVLAAIVGLSVAGVFHGG